jgi:hypothetical protein
MLAVIAAILFGLALLFELLKTNLGDISNHILEVAGLFFLACHFASSHGWRGRGWRR